MLEFSSLAEGGRWVTKKPARKANQLIETKTYCQPLYLHRIEMRGIMILIKCLPLRGNVSGHELALGTY